jgi:hypothetical protein
MVTSAITPSSTPAQSKHKISTPAPAQNSEQAPQLTPAQQQKASLNAAIVESTQVNIGAKDQSLALLLNTAIDKINELLAPTLGEDAIQKAADSGMDISPEATAERIVSLSTAFYNAFKEQNSEDEESVVLQKFMDTIGKGIDQGFQEARDILEGLKVLEGDIASNIDQTYTLVQDKLAAFEAMITERGTENNSPVDAGKE